MFRPVRWGQGLLVRPGVAPAVVLAVAAHVYSLASGVKWYGPFRLLRSSPHEWPTLGSMNPYGGEGPREQRGGRGQRRFSSDAPSASSFRRLAPDPARVPLSRPRFKLPLLPS
eukprot:7654855-Lingulodinium_polyedra.AAC.1